MSEYQEIAETQLTRLLLNDIHLMLYILQMLD